jgi:SAM-dependent methyltransferase
MSVSPSNSDRRQYAPATDRNRDPILSVLQDVLPPDGTVLEISSGTGQHAIFFAPRLAPRRWLPSDISPLALDSIAAWQTDYPCETLYPPIQLDVCQAVWPVEPSCPPALADFDTTSIQAIVSINMVHISPWDATLGLLAGARRLLPIGGVLYLYGPYKRNGQHTAPSNAAFDVSLRSQNPQWGIRNLEDVIEVAIAHQLTLMNVIEMPANNLSVVFQRRG